MYGDENDLELDVDPWERGLREQAGKRRQDDELSWIEPRAPRSVKFDPLISADDKQAISEGRAEYNPRNNKVEQLERSEFPCDQLGRDEAGNRAQLVTQIDKQEATPRDSYSPDGYLCDQLALDEIKLINERKGAVARYRRVLAARMLSPFRPMTSMHLATALGCSRSSAQRVLRDLVAAGVARQQGERRYRCYFATTGRGRSR